jgi:hypothetical protein
MNVKAYAANAANMIGITVAGMDTVTELMNAVPMLLSAIASWKFVIVQSVPKGLTSVVHHPDDTASSVLRKEVISRPIVGTVQSTHATSRAIRVPHPPRRAALGRLDIALVCWSAAAGAAAGAACGAVVLIAQPPLL